MKRTLTTLTLCLVAACATPANKEVTLSDGPLLYPTVRTAVSFLPKRVSEGRQHHAVGEIEVDLSGAWGDGQQQIDAGEFVRLGGFERSGPALLRIDYSLFQASAVARGGWRAGNWELLGFGGLGLVQAEVEVDDGVDRGRIKEDALGPLFGLQVAWEPLPRFDLYTRGSLLFTDDNESRMAELGAGYRFVDWGRIFVAYRWWRYEFEPEFFAAGGVDDLTNHVDLRTNGFVLGIEFRF